MSFYVLGDMIEKICLTRQDRVTETKLPGDRNTEQLTRSWKTLLQKLKHSNRKPQKRDTSAQMEAL